ncbi:hypothetical protein GIB67_021237 [Kingdonia uniflora]|uniref:Uncharacterized protein n=1 Tax=Kingdonia uniflora TaxID=39325 RepID=A0A7J7LFH9_9MAGN|nr:hypothetical protein GIB67_021237 [Kingdonia uniflora]
MGISLIRIFMCSSAQGNTVVLVFTSVSSDQSPWIHGDGARSSLTGCISSIILNRVVFFCYLLVPTMFIYVLRVMWYCCYIQGCVLLLISCTFLCGIVVTFLYLLMWYCCYLLVPYVVLLLPFCCYLLILPSKSILSCVCVWACIWTCI